MMGISGLNNYNNTYASLKSISAKSNSDSATNGTDLFKHEVLSWKEKVKKKMDNDLKNDQEKNIMMSEKQWNALMKKVDSAINAYKEEVKTEVEADCKFNNENKHNYDDTSVESLKEKEEFQLSAQDFVSLTSNELLDNMQAK